MDPAAVRQHHTTHARHLILQHGWNTTAYQILNPGFELWFSQKCPAVIGYVHYAGRRVVAGAPVCSAADLQSVVAEFEDEANLAGQKVVYFAAEERLATLFEGCLDHSTVRLGDQPMWVPANWPNCIDNHQSLRAQLNRARNKNVRIELWPSSRASQDSRLHDCLQQWLEARPLPPLHFLVEPETFGALEDRRIFVALQRCEDGERPVGFLTGSPIPGRNGWLIEQFVRGSSAPNGTIELLIDNAIRWMSEQNASYVTLGLAPLSHRSTSGGYAEPMWLQLTLKWIRAHGRRFYHFDGLEAFKAKFNPECWDPVYAISNEPKFSARSLYAIAAAFTNGKIARTVAGGVIRALSHEWHMYYSALG